MTIAVSLKVNDGLVLSADSASTIASDSGGVENVYNNANKILNLRKGLPIGLITWGLGGLAGLSISTLAKDLRWRLAGKDPGRADWELDPGTYQLADVADRARALLRRARHAEPRDHLVVARRMPSSEDDRVLAPGYTSSSPPAPLGQRLDDRLGGRSAPLEVGAAIERPRWCRRCAV